MLRTGDDIVIRKVGRAKAEERWWELEIEMIEQLGPTLPPGDGPVDHFRHGDPSGLAAEDVAKSEEGEDQG